MSWDQGLYDDQRAVAGYTGPVLRVVAGAGTGKSYAIKRRVARLLESGESPTSILAVTFTRTAARDLLNDLSSLQVPGCEDVDASTLHSFCFRILGLQEVLRVTGRTPRPLLDYETKFLLWDLNDSVFGVVKNRRKLLKAFEAAWARLQHEEVGWPDTEVDKQFQASLLAWLRFHQAMLIGELIPETLRYLQNNPQSPERRMYKHVLVDEYQDLNRAMQELIKLITRDSLEDLSGTLTVAGDDDQSIYSFNHAHPEGIIEFSSLYPDTHTETLVDCRRCPISTVRIANNFMTWSRDGRQGKMLNKDPNNASGEIKIVQWASIEAEAQGLASIIAMKVRAGEVEPGQVLVLTPRRLIGYKVRNALEALSIPVRSFFYEEALQGEQAQERFALLTLLAHPQDRVALRVLLGIGSSNGMPGGYARIRNHCEAKGDTPWSVLERLDSGSIKLPYTSPLLAKFRKIRPQLARLRDLELEDLVEQWLPDNMDGIVDGIDDLRKLTHEVLPEVTTIVQLYEELRTRITQPDLPDRQDKVSVMSLHKAKGLTADMVVVGGCIQGLIPNMTDDEPPEEIERLTAEQRRLFFVALTRTKRVLVLSSSVRISFGEAQRMGARTTRQGATIASEFLSHLGPTAPDAIRGDELLERWRTSTS